jgi:hypothetical protein
MRQSQATPQERIVLLVPPGRNPILECGRLNTALFGGGLTPPLAAGHSQPLAAPGRRLLQSAVKPVREEKPTAGKKH